MIVLNSISFQNPYINRKIRQDNVILSRADDPDKIKNNRKVADQIPDDYKAKGYAMVYQRSYSIVKRDDKNFNKAFTLYVNTCIVVTFYDKKSGVGILAHFDGGTEVENSMSQIFNDLEAMGADVNDLEVRVVGGMPDVKNISEDLYARIRTSLENRNICEEDYTEKDIMSSKGDVNLMLDSSDGQLYDLPTGTKSATDNVRYEFSHASSGYLMNGDLGPLRQNNKPADF